MEEDAKVILWGAHPRISANEVGTDKNSHPTINKEASHHNTKQGGANIMDIRSHIASFQSQWINKYLHPREAPWKTVLDHWLYDKELGRAIILTKLRPQDKPLMDRLPKGATYIRDCLKEFLALEIKQYTTLKGKPLLAEPLWRNNRKTFNWPTQDIAQWEKHLKKRKLGDLFSPTGTPLTTEEWKTHIENSVPPHLRSSPRSFEWRDEREEEASNIYNHLPSDTANIARAPNTPNMNNQEIIALSNLNNPSIITYARTHTKKGGPTTHTELWLDTNRDPHETGNPIDISQFDRTKGTSLWTTHKAPKGQNPEDEEEETEPSHQIMGPISSTFPRAEGWFIGKPALKQGTQTNPCDHNGTPYGLPDLTIHYITEASTKLQFDKHRPSAELGCTTKKLAKLSADN